MVNSGNGRRFYEVQYFWQQQLSWLVWIVCAGALFALSSAGAIHNGFAVFMSVIVVGVVILVTFTQLHTEVSESGISYKMKPFHKSFRTYKWDEIESAYVRKYKPLREYGGWGVRIGLNGKAFNVKGNQGLQIVLVSGERILLGTQRPESLQAVLDEIGHG